MKLIEEDKIDELKIVVPDNYCPGTERSCYENGYDAACREIFFLCRDLPSEEEIVKALEQVRWRGAVEIFTAQTLNLPGALSKAQAQSILELLRGGKENERSND